MIEARHSRAWSAERRYVLSVLLQERLGLDVRSVVEDRSDTAITREGAPGAVIISDGLFALPEDLRLSPASIPSTRFLLWRVTDDALSAGLTSGSLPLAAPFNAERPVERSDGNVHIRFDLLGWIFMAITRYEEVMDVELDRHGRFPMTASVAWREGFHRRPLVDEYVYVLSWALRAAGVIPKAGPHSSSYRVHLTHDVDRPVAALEDGARGLIRRTAADLSVRRDLVLAGSRLASFPMARGSGFSRDPNYSFEFLMDVAEAAGQRALFNILARPRWQAGAEPPSAMDAAYSLSDRPIRALIRRVLERGHQIGLHGSYNSYVNAEQLALEMGALRVAIADAGKDVGEIPARQHYLRWKTPDTWSHLADAGASSDSTLGYAEEPGFRCGTCHPFPVFDLTRRVVLPLWEHPLIVMDVSLQPRSLQRGPVESVLGQVGGMISACRRVGGEFVLLWHNNNAVGKRGRAVYRELVALASGSSP